MSAFGVNLLQNYFCDQNKQDRFKNGCSRAILIQDTAQSDSIIARSQCSKEFCNTFRVRADIAVDGRNVRF